MGRSQRRAIGPRSMPRRPPCLGLDVGGVLVDRVAEGEDTSFFGSHPMGTPLVTGSLEAVRQLVPLFDHRVHVVSKAGPKIAALTRRWLGVHGFLGREGLPPANVHFVRRRPEKHPVCAALGVTHFVDDRLDVLEHLVTVEHRYLFTGGLGRHEPPRAVPSTVTVVDSWPRLIGLLLRDLTSC